MGEGEKSRRGDTVTRGNGEMRSHCEDPELACLELVKRSKGT
jgi:hypothetical protein